MKIKKVKKQESDELQAHCENCGEIFIIYLDPNAKVGESKKPVCPSCGNSDGSKIMLYL